MHMWTILNYPSQTTYARKLEFLIPPVFSNQQISLMILHHSHFFMLIVPILVCMGAFIQSEHPQCFLENAVTSMPSFTGFVSSFHELVCCSAITALLQLFLDSITCNFVSLLLYISFWGSSLLLCSGWLCFLGEIAISKLWSRLCREIENAPLATLVAVRLVTGIQFWLHISALVFLVLQYIFGGNFLELSFTGLLFLFLALGALFAVSSWLCNKAITAWSSKHNYKPPMMKAAHHTNYVVLDCGFPFSLSPVVVVMVISGLKYLAENPTLFVGTFFSYIAFFRKVACFVRIFQIYLFSNKVKSGSTFYFSVLVVTLTASIVPSVGAVNPGSETHFSSVSAIMDIATIAGEVAMHVGQMAVHRLPERALEQAGVQNIIDISDQSDDEFEKATSNAARSGDVLKTAAVALAGGNNETNIAKTLNCPPTLSNSSYTNVACDDDNDFMDDQPASKKHKSSIKLEEDGSVTKSRSLRPCIPSVELLRKGDTFAVNSVEEVIKHVKDYGKKQNVQVSQLPGTKLKKKGEIVRNPVVHLGCSRSGYSGKMLEQQGLKQPKKCTSEIERLETSEISKPVATRKSSSFKCGCEWKISFSFSTLNEGFLCKVTCVSLEHTNGCEPSPAQFSIVKQRLGGTFMCIPKPLAVTLSVVFRGRWHNSTIKELLRQFHVIGCYEQITPMMLANLRHRFEVLTPDQSEWMEENFSVPIEQHDSDMPTHYIERCAADYVRSQMNEDGGASVVDLFMKLKEQYPGFDFRIGRNSKQELTAWMFMTPEMKFMAAKYSQVLFLDAVKSKISAVDWPFYPVTVIDEENKLYIIAFCLCVQESNEAYAWILQSIKSIVPCNCMHHVVKVTMSDWLIGW